MVDINKLVRENVIKLTPYSSARDEFQGSSGTFMDANENPFGSLNRYPDPYQKELKKAVSRIKGVGEERIFLGNGSDEIIDLCYRIFCTPGKDSALIFPPTYGMYEVAASANDVKVLKLPLDTELQIDILKTGNLLTDKSLKLIFICSPNNPTANSMNYNDVESIISRFNGMVVIDEAYIDFSEKPSFMKLMSGYPNLIIMQTFSKAFGMAAVRVGMAFSDPQVIRYFNKMKPPYNISTVNQKAVLRKLEKQDEYRQQVQRIKSERERLAAILKGMSLVEKVYPSDANFLLVKVKDANYIYESLIRKNIVVRNSNSVIQNCIRITVGKPAENNKLINAFKSIAQ
jgi:histidinol-phosphate aminotransferase